MNANLLIKSILHVVAGVMTLSFAALSFDHNMPLAIGLLPAAVVMLLLSWKHPVLLPGMQLRTSLFLVFDAIVLAFIAFQLYKQGYHKATFLYEGVCIFFFSLAAFVWLLRRKRAVFFTSDDNQ